MKTFKLFLIILILSLILSYIYFIITNDGFYTFKIGFPYTIYYQMKVDNELQFSYLPKNILKNIVIIYLVSLLSNIIYKQLKKNR